MCVCVLVYEAFELSTQRSGLRIKSVLDSAKHEIMIGVQRNDNDNADSEINYADCLVIGWVIKDDWRAVMG